MWPNGLRPFDCVGREVHVAESIGLDHSRCSPSRSRGSHYTHFREMLIQRYTMVHVNVYRGCERNKDDGRPVLALIGNTKL